MRRKTDRASTPRPDGQPMRFGVWAAVHGSRAATDDPEEPYDASWERNRALVLEAEHLGYDATLIAQHTMNPHDDRLDQLDAWSAAAALAAVTSRIELIAAIKPGLFHPTVLAKMALGIEAISGGRFAINLVNAWNGAEFERAGMAFPAHDDRYAYGREWIEVMRGLMEQESLTYAGQHFRLTDYRLRPHATKRARPAIYLGGESEPGRALAADHADTWFINGQPPEQVATLIADVAQRDRRGAAPIRFGLSAFVIARDTEAEARTAYRRLVDLAARQAARRAAEPGHGAAIDPKVVMIQTMKRTPSVGTNGGTAAGLVGSFEQVAERIGAFHRAGIELFMLQFQPFERDMRRFASEVMPRARDEAFRRSA